MKGNEARSLVTILPVVLLVAACTSDEGVVIQKSGTPVDGGARVVAFVEGEPGGVVANTMEANLKVAAIDKETRSITLVGAAGEDFTVKAGPEIVNFDQVEAGDVVKITMSQAMIVFMDDGQASAEDMAGLMAAAVPEGEKPGMVVADAAQLTATVSAIDTEARTATLRLADGSSRTVPVRADVDLAKRKVGEQVVFNMAEMITIEVVNP